MRKLIVLFLGFGLAWFAAQMLLSQHELTSFFVRDGVGLALTGAILFALSVQTPRVRPSTLYAWSNLGQALFGAGAATGVFGAALHLLHIPHAEIVIGVGVVIMMIGAWQRGAPVRYAPPAARWERNAQGRFVRIVDDALLHSLEGSRPARWRTPFVILVLATGSAARLLWLDGALAACSARECLSALALVNGHDSGAWLFSLIAQLTYASSNDAVWSIHLTAACIGCLTLPLFWLAARRIARPDGALLGLLLLSFLPWHLWASRHAAPWIEAPLWMSLGLWAGVAAVQSNDRRYWTAAAVVFSAFALLIPGLSLAALTWWVTLALTALFIDQQARWRRAMIVLAAGAPLFLAMNAASHFLPQMDHLAGLPTRLFILAAPLLVDQADLSLTTLLAPSVCAGLIIVGVASLTRYRAAGLFLMAGATASALALALRPAPVVDVANDALVLLAPLLLAGAAAIDQLVGQTQRVWAAVMRPGAVTAVAGAALTVSLLVSVADLRQSVTAEEISGVNRTALAAAQYMTAMENDESPLILLPKPLFDEPLVQLSTAKSIQAGLSRPFVQSRDLPFLDEPSSDVIYLFPVQESALQRLVQSIYPTGENETIFGDDGEPLLFVLRVARNALIDAHGLTQATINNEGAADLSIRHGPLHFASPDPASPSEMQNVVWRGSLLIPTSGDYRFAVQSPPGALFTLLLDNRLTLDTSAGLTEQTISLPQGWQSLDIRFRRGDEPGDLIVQWQPPGGELTPIPAEALFNPSLPNMGLQASYYGGDNWDGPPIAQRKEWLIRPDDSLSPPYSVHWQGKIAAPRGGEMLIGVVTDGFVQVDVDGRRVIDFRANPATGELTNEGVIVLEQGWHGVEIRYATGSAAPEFKLYWQPPGSGPAPLPPEMLAPTTVDLAALDLPLPAPPPLVDERLGDDAFALSASIDLWQPGLRLALENSPPLPLEHVWTTGGCGAGVGQFGSVRGVDLDPEGERIYVADAGNRRVVTLGLDGQRVEVLPIEGLVEPVDVALAPDGLLLILDALLPGVVQFAADSGSGLVTPFDDELQRPRGLDVDSLGLIYVADTGGARVAVFDSGGRLIAEFGGPDSTLGQGQPVDVLLTGRSIWAMTAGDGRLWQLDSLGSLTAVPPTDVIFGPQLAGLPDGRFFVSDPMGRRIVFMGANGRPLAQFAGGGALMRPNGVAVAMRGGELLLVVGDTAACTVSLWWMMLDELPR
jgi:hypothetical protein